MRNLGALIWAVAAALVTLAASSCGVAPSDSRDSTGDGGSSAGGDPSDGGAPLDASSFAFDDVAAGSGCDGASFTCSADLHALLDCNGKVAMACPPDQGCGTGGKCVPACQAAHDNRSTVGCEYLDFDPRSSTDHQCFAMYIVNTWSTEIGITIDFDGQP